MSRPLLEARQLAVEIGGHCVVRALDLTVATGERLAILGRNGAGKSTLLSTLAGLRPAAGGALLLDGEDCALMAPRRAALCRAWLGQFQADPFGSTVLETALTGRHPHLGRWTGKARAMPNWRAAPWLPSACRAWKNGRSIRYRVASASAWPSPRC